MTFELSAARHVMVTGAAGAIGGALAGALAAQAKRARLTLVDRDERGVHAVASRLGEAARAVLWDLAIPEELGASYAAATEGCPVDVLVNCAGIMELRSFAGTPWALGSRLLNVDLVSPARLMGLAVPGMRARGAGVVINVASLAAVLPIRGASFYGAAKAGIAAMSEIAHLELAPEGVHVMTVYPGPVSSGLERHARAQVRSTRVARWLPVGDAERLAARIVRAVRSREARVVFPSVYVAAARTLGLARFVTGRWSPEPFE